MLTTDFIAKKGVFNDQIHRNYGRTYVGKTIFNRKFEFKKYKRFWVDFDAPTEEEAKCLADIFHFHPLAIEDCINKVLQRPKLDYYDDHTFLLHILFVRKTKKF